MEASGTTEAQREQRWRSLEERGEVERGREKQLLAQLCHGASIPTDLSQLISELWFRAALQSVACGWKGFFSPMAFPFCGFSGEYKMRVVWGSWLCCAGRARSGLTPVASTGRNVCPSGSGSDMQVRCREHYPSWVRASGAWWDKGAFCCPLLTSVLRLSVFLTTWHILEQGLHKLGDWPQYPNLPIIWAQRES